jgi:hypothetical protein
MKGIIYKITCNETGEVYFGSTTLSLNSRISMHKTNCKRWKEGKYGFTTSFNIIDRGNYSYRLIETVECEDKKQLEARERYYIENNECINKFIPCRTQKEYDDANKDKKKEHREANKEHYNKYMKEYMKAYYKANKEHYNELRRERRAKAKLLKNTID